MNKKQFLGLAALTVVTVAGVRYYQWIKTKALEFFTSGNDHNLSDEERLERWEESLLDDAQDTGVWTERTRPPKEETDG